MHSNYFTQIERFPYIEAKDYTNPHSIFEAFPKLQTINHQQDWKNRGRIEGVVIRSANDDNVHKVHSS